LNRVFTAGQQENEILDLFPSACTALPFRELLDCIGTSFNISFDIAPLITLLKGRQHAVSFTKCWPDAHWTIWLEPGQGGAAAAAEQLGASQHTAALTVRQQW
jgi:hypothetical protein